MAVFILIALKPAKKREKNFHASDYAVMVDAKPWEYLLVPHDEINESKRVTDFLRFGGV
jgi:hypothetical protein